MMGFGLAFHVWNSCCTDKIEEAMARIIVSPYKLMFLFCLLSFFVLSFILLHSDPLSATIERPQARAQQLNQNSNVLQCKENTLHPSWQQNLIEKAGEGALLAGNRSEGVKSLVLGLASVWRKENYLKKTLWFLIDQSDESERKDAVIVIYLADPTSDKLDLQLTMIKENFQEFLDSGFFLVIWAGPEIYPPLELAVAKKTYNDPDDRIRWRAKQLIDFTFLFTYAQPLAHFYVVLEDDLDVAPEYLSAIKDFVHSRTDPRWVALEFTEFLGIGLTYRTKDLPNLVQFLFRYWTNHPVDELMREFIHLEGQPTKSVVKRIPSLFQHIGTKSTYEKKEQKLKDRSFGNPARKFKNKNPPAHFNTSMQIYEEFYPFFCYRQTPGIFWGMMKTNETFDINFDKNVNISRIVILTGLPEGKLGLARDRILSGTLEYTATEGNDSQINYKRLTEFKGDVDIDKSILNVNGIRIWIEYQKNWVIIREVQIFQIFS